MLSVIFVWKCDECGATHVETHGDYRDGSEVLSNHIGFGAVITTNMLPSGWSVIDGRMICPLHSVSVKPLERHMRRIKVNPGDEYGELTVISEVESTGKRQFLCKCACGQKVTVRLGHLRSGHTSSCGRCGIEYRGKRRTLRAWASLFGLKESTLRARLKVMDIGEALERG